MWLISNRLWLFGFRLIVKCLTKSWRLPFYAISAFAGIVDKEFMSTLIKMPKNIGLIEGLKFECCWLSKD
jgi:hypothetical protein